MSASTITGTTASRDLPEDDTILALTGGENPLEFLTMNGKTIYALIAGMSDPDRIEGWRRAESELIDSDRDDVIDALERQAAALEAGQTPPIYHPFHDRYDPDQDPLVDEGENENAKADSEAHSETRPEPTHEVHSEANLEVGEILVVERGDSVEYVWPQRAGEDDPYVLEERVDDELRQQLPLTASDAFDRLQFDPDRRDVDEIHVDAPETAAVNRGGGGE